MKQKKDAVSRRKFISTSAKGAAVVGAAGLLPSQSLMAQKSEPGKMPMRTLGKTGLDISILTFGGGSQFLKNPNGEWEPMLEEALEAGINVFDTSPNYTWASRDGSKGLSSEERFGEVLAPYRDDIILSTKLLERTPGSPRKELEVSLKAMKTDYLDILMIHALEDRDQLSDIEKGIWKEMVQLKEEGLVKYIGFSSMDSAVRSKQFIENLEMDAVMLADNPSRYGDYESIAFPAAKEKNVGIFAIKVLRYILGKDGVTAEELLNYSWSQEGMTSACIAHDGIDNFRANVASAIAYGDGSMVNVDKEGLQSRLAHCATPDVLGWARPGYKDGGIVV